MNKENAAMADASPRFISWPDERLQRAAVMRPPDDRMRSVGMALLDAAQAVQAYGLAAHHLGHVEPVAVVSIADPSARDYRILYNPCVIELGDAMEAGKEGSVSMPGIEVDVVRSERAIIACQDDTGAAVRMDLDGFPARVAQHEIDQVNGVFFLARLSRLKRDAAIKRFSKLGKRMG
ncbi:peptide deformylase [Devosia lucknowensis]|uniref:Peptide deformylase-like n=1 Tax=Devosia lucknowensis TaxID=1096929 RepID=A0A1Y6EU06_9HYPH|nr:peptide deformylase [Devosia lucknowensis]SMQ63992.1 peptide deformylase [Devosia lucknowensis]